MNNREISRSELLASLEDLRSERKAGQDDGERLPPELQVHQVELMVQNDELREIQHKFEGSLNRYADLYDFAPVGYATFDGKGCFREINLTAAAMLGVERSHLLGMPFGAYVAKGDIQQFLDHLYACKARSAITAEITLAPKGGKPLYVQLSSNCVTPAPPDGPLYRTVITDLTEHRRAGEELRLARQLKNIIEFLPSAIFAIDRDGIVIAWNRAMEDLTGIPKDGMIGLGNHAYAVPFYGEPRPILIDLVMHGERTARLSYPELEGEGEVLGAQVYAPALYGGKGAHLAIRAAPLRDDQGQRVGAIEQLQDLTRQRSLEEAGARAQKLESLGLLAGGIAHDFNNYLAVIPPNLQLIKAKATKGLEIERHLTAIQDVIRKMVGLTNQLLTFARGGAPVKKAVSLAKLIEETSGFALRGSRSGCELSLAGDLWLVEADEGQISQVLSNLVINANEAMPAGGAIKIAAENARVKARSLPPLRAGRYVKISVADSGQGIAAADLARIFDPYFTTKQRGNGLGLTTCHSIITRHGGHISVASEVGKGTTVDIYLPAARTHTAAARDGGSGASEGKGRILLMDDERDIREATGEVLGVLGYEVEYAAEGEEAVRKYVEAKRAGEPFAAVIMDLTIRGGLGGKETIARLREIDPGVKAVVSSGYSNDPVMADFREHGFLGVVAKPYLIEELSKVLRRVMAG